MPKYNRATRRSALGKGEWLAPQVTGADVNVETADELSRRLRLSLTSTCNFGCFFCHNEGQQIRPQAPSSLSVSDLVSIVDAAISSGVRSVKLTGGEPLLYRDHGRTVVDLVAQIASLRDHGPWFDISMTTNGTLLPKYASDLREAGLDRATVSIHALDEAHFAAYVARSPASRFFNPMDALAALEAARFERTKINTVVFGDRIAGSIRQLPRIVQVARQFGVEELRLYTIIDADRVVAGGALQRNWLDGLAREVADALAFDEQWIDAVENFAARRAAVPELRRETIRFQVDGMRLAIDAMQPGRYGLELSDEGPYAIRVGADGSIRAFLNGSTGVFNTMLALGDPSALKQDMLRARGSLLTPINENALAKSIAKRTT